MTLRVCLDCTTAFTVGAPRCPHCGSERHAEQGSALALGIQASVPIEEEHMPKITRHGGASFREDPGTGEPMTAVEANELVGDGSGRALPPVEEEGGEQPSVGSSGETSSEKPSDSPARSETETPPPARRTGSRSGKRRTAGSTARSTDGGQADAESATDSADV